MRAYEWVAAGVAVAGDDVMRNMRTLVLGVLGLAACAAVVGLARQPGTGESPSVTKQKETVVKYSKSGRDVTPLGQTRIDELAKGLTPEEAAVILAKGTERAFCGNLVDNKKDGTYLCRLCDLPLFSSGAKFDSGTGWPSFFQPFDPAHIREESDRSYGMVRTEILCARCGGHLGHVFDDGPKPTGRRYCLNSVSLTFVEKDTALPAGALPVKTETAYFAGGCFWGVEDRFQQVPGVIDAVSGYMGGKVANPTYKQVCEGTTQHAETVKVVFDPARVTYGQLLEWFFKFHNPSQVNRQGPDVGTQYRSAIFTADAGQQAAAAAFIEAQRKTPRYLHYGVATQVVPIAEAGEFWPAEEYHQDYHLKHGGSCALPEIE
ncbi:MAG: peptide methionine sulfoxide reductase MsrA [Phycisphaerae bacterium]|nr:MAG: peptide methionine sulfoxide reductase MsrA [Phycisphaerae bacterium]